MSNCTFETLVSWPNLLDAYRNAARGKRGRPEVADLELRVPGYVRYVDDLLVFGCSKRDLWRWKAEMVRRLSSLRVTLHPGAHPRPVAEGIPFLGWVVWPERRRLKRRKAVQGRRRLVQQAKDVRRGKAERAALVASVVGWTNHARYGNTVGLRKALRRAVIAGLRG